MACMDTDEVLKGLARESVKQGENLRAGVRELTLNALRGRELTVEQIKRVVRAVTEGVSLGATTSGVDPDRVLGEAFSGLDEAVLKAVKDATKKGSEQLRGQWAKLLQQKEDAGTATQTQIEQTLEQFGERMRDAMRQQRRMAVKASEAMAGNFATLASGILIGLTE